MPPSTAPRFFIEAPLTAGESIALPPAVAHHALRVLRLRRGEAITLFNGRGGEYAARLVESGRATIERFDAVERESPLALTLVQALIAVDKLDWVVEKAVELGVHRIVIAPAERSVVRLGGERLRKRLVRWNEITVAACCQCGRNRLPAVDYADRIETALRDAPAERKLVLCPDAEASAPAGAAVTTTLAVGPEGGFSQIELEIARRCGFAAVRLGPRVLRTETAGLAAVAALQFAQGDLA